MSLPISVHPEIDLTKYAAVGLNRGRYRPIMLVIETVNICNNDCVFCAYSSQHRARKTMDVALFRKIVDDYVAIGGGCLSLTPVVGEVFLDKRLVERVKYARRFPEITSLSATTNAVMCNIWNDNDLCYVVKNLNQIHISIYGIDDEEYRALTKRDKYHKMIEGIRRILDCADGTVLFGFRFLKDHSAGEIDEWIRAVRSGTRYNGEIACGSTRDYANWSVLDTTRPLPFGATWKPTPNNVRQCAIPLFACQVLVNGSVSFCSCPNFDDDAELSLGNIRDTPLIDLLNNDRSFKLWDWGTNGVPEFCRKCSFHAPIDVIPRMEWVFNDPVRQIGG